MGPVNLIRARIGNAGDRSEPRISREQGQTKKVTRWFRDVAVREPKRGRMGANDGCICHCFIRAVDRVGERHG